MQSLLKLKERAGACAPEKSAQGVARLIDCLPGKYIIHSMLSEKNRLLEIGFIPGKSFYLIANNSFAIKIKVNVATYLLNEIVASAIYVQLTEE